MPTYSRLTREQRYTIEAMNRNGSPQKEIAAAFEGIEQGLAVGGIETEAAVAAGADDGSGEC